MAATEWRPVNVEAGVSRAPHAHLKGRGPAEVDWLCTPQTCRPEVHMKTNLETAVRTAVETQRPIPAHMMAAVYRGVGDVRLETVPVPRIGRGELLVRVHTC